MMSEVSNLEKIEKLGLVANRRPGKMDSTDLMIG